MHKSEQNLKKIEKLHPQLYDFIYANRKLSWLDWQTFLTSASQDDLDNMNRLLKLNKKYNKNEKDIIDPLVSEEFQISLIEMQDFEDEYGGDLICVSICYL